MLYLTVSFYINEHSIFTYLLNIHQISAYISKRTQTINSVLEASLPEVSVLGYKSLTGFILLSDISQFYINIPHRGRKSQSAYIDSIKRGMTPRVTSLT